MLEDVVINNKVCIPKGTFVKGQLLKLLPAQNYGIPGFIDLIIPKIKTNENTNVPIIGRYIKSGISERRKVRNINMIGSLVIFIGPPTGFDTIFLETLLYTSIASGVKGKNVIIPKGEEFVVWSRYDTFEGRVSNTSSEDNVLETLKAKMPPDVIFPNIVNAPLLVDLIKANDILSTEINKYKLGNRISTQLFYDYKKAIYQNSDLLGNDSDLTCAKVANGYYLKVDLNIGANQVDKGTFELYDPRASILICKFEVKEFFGWNYDDSAKKLLQKGIQKLSKKIKKIKPSLIKS